MPEQLIRRYEAAGGVVVDPAEDRILILVVSDRTAPQGLPEARLPKGHIEPAEGRAQAAVREVLEETGLAGVEVVADLGHQVVEFDHQDRLVVRDESYFLMIVQSRQGWGRPECRFERSWLTWDEALDRLTYEPEREWVRRGRQAWAGRKI
jgi:8-oxo-dGTP pyrophosphatase MutT (NUDIX family)